MLFGVPMTDSGLKRYPVQNRPRIMQYAVTLVLRENNQDFISSLQQKLKKIYPLHQQIDPSESAEYKSSVIYVYYPGEFNLIELVPLSIAMTLLFIYMYFSIRKVEMIRSRIIVALSSVLTVLGSLVMSLGFCFFFGISIWTQSTMGVYPYLLILVGLENCLVLTKSVMTTENNLDVKIRVAQGLSKEGWPITKNLMTEITILTAGLVLTFLPLIQEFCIFAIVGLVSDHFLQMFLFSTVLGLNVKRVAVIAEVKKLPKMLEQSTWQNKSFTKSLSRSISHPSQLSELDHKDSPSVKPQEKKIPKRLRVVNFWARTRLFQRGFMIWMVLWISNIIYTSGIIEHVFSIDKPGGINATEGVTINGDRNEAINSYEHMVKNLSSIMMDYYAKNVQWKRLNENMELNVTDKIQKLKHPQFEISNKLSSFHWAGIFKQYNISMIGRYVTVLPSIKISHVVPVEVALKIRNPNEITPSTSKWNALANALEPLDRNDDDVDDDLLDLDPIENQPLYPKTPMEMALLIILCAVSVFVITYTMVVMYRCICSRNYAEWRASRWDEGEVIETNSEQVLEGFPIQVKGHKHNVECVVSDGSLVASSCLQGLLKIWDSSNGDLVAEIDRISYFEQLQQYNVERKMTSASDENLIQKSPTPQHQSSEGEMRNNLRLRSSLPIHPSEVSQ
jgi:Sterol-sensing domain of SREBP cleavage-activation